MNAADWCGANTSSTTLTTLAPAACLIITSHLVIVGQSLLLRARRIKNTPL